MEIKNSVTITLENFKKCRLMIDSDCPLGELFDYSTALTAFVVEKIQESQKKETKDERPEENAENQNGCEAS